MGEDSSAASDTAQQHDDTAPAWPAHEEGTTTSASCYEEGAESAAWECESVGNYSFLELKTLRGYSDVGDHGYQWWAQEDAEMQAADASGAQSDSEPDDAPYDLALVLVELTGVLAWIDEHSIYTTHSFCDVSAVEASTWGKNYRLHYRLKAAFSMLVSHPKAILGVTCVNSRYG